MAQCYYCWLYSLRSKNVEYSSPRKSSENFTEQSYYNGLGKNIEASCFTNVLWCLQWKHQKRELIGTYIPPIDYHVKFCYAVYWNYVLNSEIYGHVILIMVIYWTDRTLFYIYLKHC